MHIDPTSSPIANLPVELPVEPAFAGGVAPGDSTTQPFTLDSASPTGLAGASGGVGAAPGAEGVARPLDPYGALLQVQQEFGTRLAGRQEFWDRVHAGEIKPTDPQFMQEMQRQSEDLFVFQMKAQQASLGVELMSKVIEHATSSTRNVLQTQA